MAAGAAAAHGAWRGKTNDGPKHSAKVVHGTWYRAGSGRRKMHRRLVPLSSRRTAKYRRGGSCEVVCLRLPGGGIAADRGNQAKTVHLVHALEKQSCGAFSAPRAEVFRSQPRPKNLENLSLQAASRCGPRSNFIRSNDSVGRPHCRVPSFPKVVLVKTPFANKLANKLAPSFWHKASEPRTAVLSLTP